MMRLGHVQHGEQSAPALILGTSIGTTHRMWQPQVDALASSFHVIGFDLPGHDATPATENVFTVADVAAAVVRLADELGVDRFAYAGLSMGGAVGQELAIGWPERLTSLVLCCTSPRFGDPQVWWDRAARVRTEGLAWLVEASRSRWFRPGAPLPAGGAELLRAQQGLDPVGYAACCEALATFDCRDRLAGVTAPTRVVAGADDVATPAAMTEALAAGIRGADLVVVPSAAHIANVEQPAIVLAALTGHLRPEG